MQQEPSPPSAIPADRIPPPPPWQPAAAEEASVLAAHQEAWQRDSLQKELAATRDELEAMRQRVASLRVGLVEALRPYGLSDRFAHIAQQRGMFSYTGLSPTQVQMLRDEFSVYMVGSGRANMAGLDGERLDQLASAIARVCS